MRLIDVIENDKINEKMLNMNMIIIKS